MIDLVIMIFKIDKILEKKLKKNQQKYWEE